MQECCWLITRSSSKTLLKTLLLSCNLLYLCSSNGSSILSNFGAIYFCHFGSQFESTVTALNSGWIQLLSSTNKVIYKLLNATYQALRGRSIWCSKGRILVEYSFKWPCHFPLVSLCSFTPNKLMLHHHSKSQRLFMRIHTTYGNAVTLHVMITGRQL